MLISHFSKVRVEKLPSGFCSRCMWLSLLWPNSIPLLRTRKSEKICFRLNAPEGTKVIDTREDNTEWFRLQKSVKFVLEWLTWMTVNSLVLLHQGLRFSHLEHFLFFLKIIYLGCVGSSLLCMSFLYLWRVRATLRCGAWASHCGGFSCCGARALGMWAQ